MNKKITAGLIALAVIFGNAAMPANIAKNGNFNISMTVSAEERADGFGYEILEDGTAEITSYTGGGTSVVIPRRIDGRKVTKIGAKAFSYNNIITEVKIPETVDEIKENAFSMCYALRSISIPNSVTKIGAWAFWYCASLTDVELPKSLSVINEWTFNSCASLKRIILPDSLTEIGEYAFCDCTSLEMMIIPASVTKIGDIAFAGCSSLTYIDTYKSNKYYSAEDGILYNKNKSELIACPAGIKEVRIPDSVSKIHDLAFTECVNLEEITLPDSVKEIGDRAFKDCSALKNIRLSKSLRKIGKSAFYSCTALKSITIPAAVDEIGNYAFYDCSALSSITAEKGNKKFSSSDGVLYGKNGSLLIFCPEAKTEVTLTSTVAEIDEGALYYCKSLKAINVESGNKSFSSVGGVLYDYNKTTVEECPRGIKSVTLPKTVKSFNKGIFNSCELLESIDVENGNENFSSENGILYNKDKSVLIFCPDNKKSAEISRSAKKIGNLAFRCCKLKSIDIPDNITEIETGAFMDCPSLKKVTLPEGLTSIGDSAFFNCPLLKTVEVPASVEKISDHALGFYVNWDPFDLYNEYEDYFEDIKVTGFRLICAEGSKAEKYAQSNHIGYDIIGKKNISSCKISVSDVAYISDYQEPEIVIKDGGNKLVKYSDYSISYDNFWAVGIGEAEIIGKGNYSGSVIKFYRINPPKVKNVELSSPHSSMIDIRWAPACDYIRGYEVQISRDKNFVKDVQTADVKYGALYKEFENLAGGKTYYVRIRAYYKQDTSEGEVYLYGKWSDTKSVRCS